MIAKRYKLPLRHIASNIPLLLMSDDHVAISESLAVEFVTAKPTIFPEKRLGHDATQSIAINKSITRVWIPTQFRGFERYVSNVIKHAFS